MQTNLWISFNWQFDSLKYFGNALKKKQNTVKINHNHKKEILLKIKYKKIVSMHHYNNTYIVIS